MIEVRRGSLTAAQADEVVAFWQAQNALSGSEARRRLDEVVCVLRRDGAIAGVNSVYPAEVGLVGGRRFWVYRSLLLDPAADSATMIRAAFTALDAEFDHRPGSAIGLCVLIADPEERRRRPEAEWSDPRMIYAGYLADGRQVRIAYFNDADISRNMILAAKSDSANRHENAGG
jgi:hypothetical protein